MARIDEDLKISDSEVSNRQDKTYTANQLITIFDSALSGGGGGGGGGGSTTNRTSQMATYQTFTNPAHVYYTALDTDGSTILIPRTNTGVQLISQSYQLYGYDQPLGAGRTDWIAVWDEGNPNNFTLSWEVVGAGGGIVTPPEPPPTGLAVSRWTASQTTSSLLHIDATASTADTYSWTIDGAARPEATAIVDYGPLSVGTHSVSLLVTKASDNSSHTHTANVDVIWKGHPLSNAQRDVANGFPGTGQNLTPWDSSNYIQLIGPWTTIDVLDQQDTANGGDGTPRIVVIDNDTVELMTRYGDRPGSPTASYRSNLQMTAGYNAAQAGYPLAALDINMTGNIPTGQTSGDTRFYRVEYLLPSTNPGGANAPQGFGTGQPFQYQNNFGEMHGTFGGAGLWRFTPEVITSPFRQGIAFQPIINGVYGTVVYFDLNTIVYDAWYNYVVEYKQSLDGTIGYMRVYRDGAVVTSVPAGTDGFGRYFAITAVTDLSSVYNPQGFNIQNYRTAATMPADYPDARVRYRNIRVGPTFASVMAS